ncbi:MAG: hypothetical protein M1828_003594, partial [Chrysothrix sp. TS-e1954]
VLDTRPHSQRTSTTLLSDPTVPKYTLPPSTYSALDNTVLSYKRTHKLGRFDPDAPTQLAAQVAHIEREIGERGIAVGGRCRLLPPQTLGATSDGKGAGEDDRRGSVAFVGPVAEIPGPEGAAWVGVKLDEPVGKNDGSVGGVVYFDAGGGRRGVFVRPERVECGDFGVLDDLEGEEMEEM